MRIQDRLLDAHVAFVVRELTGEAFAELVVREVDWVLSRGAQLHLDDVIDRGDVAAVAVKYASLITLPGAIPEVAGEIAARVRAHPANATSLDEIVPRHHAAAVIEKIAELRPLRRRVATVVAESPVVQAGLANYLRSVALWPVAANRRLLVRLPGAARALAAGERLAGGALQEADLRGRELAERAAAAVLDRWSEQVADGVDDDEFAEALLEIWDRAAGRSVDELLGLIDEADLIDLIVLLYDVWLTLRDGDWLPSLIETGVDYFFDTYGAYSLTDLLTEFGLNRDDLVEEAMRFAPRTLDALAASGDLEAFVRRQLARFYESPEAQAALTARPTPGAKPDPTA